MSTVKFIDITRAKFNSLTPKDDASVYFVKETNNTYSLYKGSTLVSSNITPPTHSHNWDEITGLQTQLNNKLNLGGGTMTGAITMGSNNITGNNSAVFQAGRIIATNSNTNDHGITSKGTRANMLYLMDDATGGLAASLLDVDVKNTTTPQKRIAKIGIFGSAVSGTGGTPSANYLWLSAVEGNTYNVDATLKVDAQNRVGIAIAGSGRPTQALDVGGKIRMRTATVDSDDADTVVTKGYMLGKIVSDTNNYLTNVTGSGNGIVTFTRERLLPFTWDASHTHAWSEITGKPYTFTPSSHTHKWSEITEKPTTFTPSSHDHTWNQITGKPSLYSPTAHNHTISEVEGLSVALDAKAPTAQVVRATTENKNILGTSEEVFNISEKKVWFNKGALFYGTAAAAGLVTRGISGASQTGNAKDHLYINYDGNNTLSRQLVLGAGSIGTDRGNGIYDYSAVRGDAFIAYLTDTLGSYENTANKRTSIRSSGANDTSYVTELGVKTYVDGLIGSVYRPAGDWNANTNSPALANNTLANAGKVYRVSVAGTRFGFTFAVGDKLAFNESGVISKWDNVDDVVSVNGETGTVVLTAAKVGARSNTWTPTWSQVTSKPTTFTPSAHGHAWGEITGKPTSYSPTAHDHTISEVEGLQTQLDSKLNLSGGTMTGSLTVTDGGDLADHITINEESIEFKHTDMVDRRIEPISGGYDGKKGLVIRAGSSSYEFGQGLLDIRDGGAEPVRIHGVANPVENEDAVNKSFLETQLSNKANSSHDHTWNEITGKPSLYEPTAHDHTISEVEGLSVALNAKAPATHSHKWSEITEKPTTFTPSSHSHEYNEIDGLPTIPTDLNQLTNTPGFIRWTQVWSGSTDLNSYRNTYYTAIVPSDSYIGKRIAIEVQYSSGTTYTSKIIFGVLGSSSSATPDANISKGIGWSYFDGTNLRVKTLFTYASASYPARIYVGHLKTLLGTFSGNSIEWSTGYSETLRMRKIWVIE